MKTKLAVLLALSTSSVFAQDLIVGDLNFFQKKGSFLYDTSLNFGKSEYKEIFDVTDKTSYGEFERATTVWNNTVTYGLADNLRVGASLNYAAKNELKNTKMIDTGVADDKDKSYEDKGLSDITLNAAYRLMNGPVFVDFTGALTVAIADAERGEGNSTSGKDGNFAQGHHSLALGAFAGQKINSFEWRAGLGIDHHFAGEFEKKWVDSTDRRKTADTEAFTDLTLSGAAQYRMNKFVVGLGLAYTKLGDRTEEYRISGDKVELTHESDAILATTLTTRYNLSDKAVINLSYQMVSKHDVDTKEKTTGGTTKGVREDVKGSTLAIGGTFLF